MKYGLQMYSVRDVTETDLYGALKQVAALGYENVEFAGFFGHDGESVAAWLKERPLGSAILSIVFKYLHSPFLYFKKLCFT